MLVLGTDIEVQVSLLLFFFMLSACHADNELQHLHDGNQQTTQENGSKRQGHGMVHGIVHGVIATTTTTSIGVTGFIVQLDFCQIMNHQFPMTWQICNIIWINNLGIDQLVNRLSGSRLHCLEWRQWQ